MIRTNDIHKIYVSGDQGVHALRGLSLYFQKGEVVAVVGPSGCGKTTLLNIIGGLDVPSSGDIVIGDTIATNLHEKQWDYLRNHTIGFVFQHYNLIEHLSIIDNVAIALEVSGISANTAREKAIKTLKEVGLEEHLGKKPNQLSGGQRQRVAIARALVKDPEIILADEPTGALDMKTSKEIMKLMVGLAKDRLVIIVTHNQKIADQFATRIIQMEDGNIISDSNPELKKVKITKERRIKRKQLKFFQSMRLALKNIKGKLWRTILVSFGLGIGIIGLLLIDGFFHTIHLSAEQQSASVATNADLLVSDYEGVSDLETLKRNVEDTGYFKDVLYYGYFNGTLIPGDSTLTDTSSYIYYRNYTELPENEELNITIKLIGDSQLPVNDHEIIVSTSQLYQFINSNLNLTDEEATDVLLDKTYRYFYTGTYQADNGMFDYYIQDGVCEVYDTPETPSTEPVNWNELLLGTFASNKAKLEAYTDDLITYSETQSIYCSNYDYLYWYLEIDETIYKELTIVGVYESSKFSEILMTESGMKAMLDLPSVEAIYENDSSITVRAFLDSDFIDTKAEVIKDLQAEGFRTTENNLSNLGLLDTLNQVYLVLIQILFSLIMSVALITGTLMLILIIYISIIERKREIGIVRSIGGSRKDIRTIYSAETAILGLSAGVFSVVVSYLLSIAINAYLYNYQLEWLLDNFEFINPKHALTMNPVSLLLAVVGSLLLALFAGLFPAISAGNKKPIDALRGE
jgi:putative ABC transport system permease protein